MADTQDGLERFEIQLRAWGAAIERLKAKVDEAVAEAKKEYYEELGKLREDIAAQLEKWEREMASAGADAGQAATDARRTVQDLRAKIEAELREWGSEIATLRAGAGRTESEAKRLAAELKARQKELKERLGKLKKASGAAWEDVRTGLGRAWDDLKPALQSAIGKFR